MWLVTGDPWSAGCGMTGVKIMIRTKGWTGRHRPTPAGASRRATSASIAHHPSSTINSPGFTLIELLVVIAVIALLTAVLMPTLRRVRRQARAVVCQANLRQWGTFLAMYVHENDGRLPEPPTKNEDDSGFREWWEWGWGRSLRADDKARDIRCCPMAAKPTNPTGAGEGGTFLAWSRYQLGGQEPVLGYLYGSYGVNGCVARHWCYRDVELGKRAWHTVDVPGADRIPVHFDHISPSVWAWQWDEPAAEPQPPACDAIPAGTDSAVHMTPCINRHDGGINIGFLDWSVRKVGLKGLWTLKWNRQFNTAGRWTKAGGVQTEDWPQWMRRFKDY